MSKVILISNRLPITIEKKDGKFLYKESSGGLVTGLRSLLDKKECIWIGYPGITSNNLSKNMKVDISEELESNYSSKPVFLSEDDVKKFYDGFSNETLWPLFHYFQSIAVYDNDMWESYKKVNKMFLEETLKVIHDDDIVWVHDYHLMLLPKLIREKLPEVKIGFFLHIPFPSSEIYRALPWREDLLEGILGADLVGFHTISYVRHFINSVQYLLGHENVFGNISFESRNVKVDTFPMGIDYNLYSTAVTFEEVKKEVAEIKKNLINSKVIVSIDRLDYTKGLLQRIESFDYFLDNYPENKEKVILILVAVPSRTTVDEYSDLTDKLDMMVSRVNGKHSTLDWAPIRYLYRSIPFNTLISLYEIADVALVTPLRDGMNLVAKEYVAVKTKSKKGVLIISEMAGVAEELGETLKINPNNKKEIADTIQIALDMPEDKQKEMLEDMQRRLKRNDVFKWANDFIDRLSLVQNLVIKHPVELFDKEDMRNLISKYDNSVKRLLLLDYDGTMVGFHKNPELAVPDDELMKILETLVKEMKNKVAIISGRDKDFLNKWFGHLNMTLVAEHGAWIRGQGSEWKVTIQGDNNIWKDEIRPLFEIMVDRTPNTWIEEKSFAIAWHFRNADKQLVSMRVKELKSNILNVISNLNLAMLEGNKVIEIKRIDIDKGKIVHQLMENEKPDFQLAIGDDKTDEDMFEALLEVEESETIKVGLEDTFAKYYTRNWRDVRKILLNIVKILKD